MRPLCTLWAANMWKGSSFFQPHYIQYAKNDCTTRKSYALSRKCILIFLHYDLQIRRCLSVTLNKKRRSAGLQNQICRIPGNIGATINTSHKFWDQSPPPLSMLFASIWDSFLAQASVMLYFQYAATLSRGEGPHLFLQSGWYQNFRKFFQELTSSQ